ncbi:protein Flattop isoform X2 [Calonectris borealis]|uniref:protein Flattop isoform X2 n=1 Tax=Calonectris borealis TaxID=1323832 RepID=UPI003F4B16E8
MAARYGAGQYEDAFSPHRLQNWSVPRPGRQHPSLREGSTPIVADDQGHLLPAVPRSQASPWGRFVGTWEMPPRIPPARLDLTSRSAAATARLIDWIRQPTALTRACNGLRTEITGKPQEPRLDAQTAKEPSRRSSRASSEGIQPARASPGSPLQEPPSPRAGATAVVPLSHKPGCTEVQLKADTSPEPPPARQPCSQQAKHGGQNPHSHQPAVTDLRHGDAGSPEIPASSRPAPRGASPRQATPLQVSAPSRGGSAEAEPQGGRSHRLRASPCAGCREASTRGAAAGVRAGRPSRAGP